MKFQQELVLWKVICLFLALIIGLSACANEGVTPATSIIKATPAPTATIIPPPLRITLTVPVTASPAEATASPTANPPSTPVSASLILVNGTLIDGTGSGPVFEAVVVIEGERIVAVGPRAQISIPPHSPTLDLQGAALLPGFINAHVHRAYNKTSLETWAQSGVTTVRDLANPGDPADLFAFQDEVDQDPEYARLVAAGPMLVLCSGLSPRYLVD